MHLDLATVLVFGGGLLTGLIAFFLGRWRHTCIFWMVTNPVQVPLGWRRSWVRVGTWVLVTALSAIYATLWAVLIIQHVNYWLGLFSWGCWLYLRWFASGLSAGFRYHKDKAELDAWLAKIEGERASRPNRSIEELKSVAMLEMNFEEWKSYSAYMRRLVGKE